MEMDIGEILVEFCETTGADPEAVADRWAGRPDRIIQDLFRFPNDRGEPQKIELFKPYQHKFIHAYFYGDAPVLNFLKGRRIGGSAVTLLCFVLEGLTMPNQLYPIVVTKEDQAWSRINDIRNILKYAVIDIPTETDNKGEIELWNGTRFSAYTSKPSGARGDGARSVMFDEMAFMEKQEEMQRAFNPMLLLSKGKLVQISTPNAMSDLFMQTQQDGTETGFTDDGEKTGVIALYQPTFNNPDEIDIEVPLWNQDLDPARPDLDIDRVEADRSQDPMGFQQEYLCIPAAENYQFFSRVSVEAAMTAAEAAEYVRGETARPAAGGQNIMAVDVGVTNDETVISVFEHKGDRRLHRYIEVVNDAALRKAGFADPDTANINQLGTRIAQVFRAMDCEFVVVDETGSGQFLPGVLREQIHGGVVGFNFSNRKAVAKMMGNMNAGLRNGRVTLVPNERLKEQLLSVTRIQKTDSQVPKFSGKDNSPDGRDDMAIASVMAAFPRGFDHEGIAVPVEKEQAQYDAPRPEYADEDAPATASRPREEAAFSAGTLRRSRGGGARRYRTRHARR